MRGNAILLALTFTLGGTAWAAARQDAEPAGSFRATELIGKEVQDPQGEKLGQVREIVVDDSGRVRYLVLGYGGFLHMGDRLTAVPWDVARPMLEKEHLVIALNRETLTDAPTLTADVWQEEGSRWMAQVERYYRTLRAKAGADFARLDTNNDGQLSPTEVESLATLHDRFRIFDEDGDGALSRSEFSAFEAIGQPAAPTK